MMSKQFCRKKVASMNSKKVTRKHKLERAGLMILGALALILSLNRCSPIVPSMEKKKGFNSGTLTDGSDSSDKGTIVDESGAHVTVQVDVRPIARVQAIQTVSETEAGNRELSDELRDRLANGEKIYVDFEGDRQNLKVSLYIGLDLNSAEIANNDLDSLVAVLEHDSVADAWSLNLDTKKSSLDDPNKKALFISKLDTVILSMARNKKPLKLNWAEAPQLQASRK